MSDDLDPTQKATIAAIELFGDKALEKIFSSTPVNRFQIFPRDSESATFVLGSIGVVMKDNDKPVSIADVVSGCMIEVKLLQELADAINLLFPKIPIDKNTLN